MHDFNVWLIVARAQNITYFQRLEGLMRKMLDI